MSNFFKRWGPATALTAAGLLAGASGHAQTIDGVRDGSYPAALATQTIQTGYGDSNLGQVDYANGSELDNIHAQVVGTDLVMFIGGNLESNFNKLTIFFDSKGGGGQNILSGNGAFLGNFNGMQFDTGVSPDYAMSLGGGGGPYTAYINFLDIPTAGGGNNGGLGDYLGAVTGGNGSITFPDASVGAMGLDNSNTAGAGGSSGTAASGAAAVSTGLEFRIPLSALGSSVNAGDIKIVAMIGNDNWTNLSNQTLGGLPVGVTNLGSPGSVNFTTRAGNQFVTVANGGSATPPTIGVSPNGVNFFNVSATGGNVTRQLTISNNGTATLNLTNVTSSNPAFTVSSTSGVIPNGGSKVITLTFNPSSGTAQTGTLTFASNDPTTPSKVINVSGTGIPAGQVVLDGRRDAGLYSQKALQTNPTGFGDNESELNGAYAVVQGSDLYLTLTGNLQDNGNKLLLFFDTDLASGVQQYNGSGAQQMPDINGQNANNSTNLGGMGFDLGFTPERFIAVALNGNGVGAGYTNLTATTGTGASLTTTGAGLYKTLTFPGALGTGELAINNANTAGVSTSSVGNPAAVTTGIELRIPLAALGTITATTPIRVMALIANGDYSFLSNQSLGGVPAGYGNLGTPSGTNFATFPGLQFFTARRGDVTITNTQLLSGDFNTVTIASGGELFPAEDRFDAAVAIVVQDGGRLTAGEFGTRNLTGTGAFSLRAGGTLRIGSAAGIAASGSTGAVRLPARSFSNDAIYRYQYNTGAAGVTGSGLPLTVRTLEVLTASSGGASTTVALTRPLNVRQMVHVAPNTILNATVQPLTLLSSGAGTALINNEQGAGGTVVGGTNRMEISLVGSYTGRAYRHYGTPTASTSFGSLQTSGFTPRVNPAYNTNPNQPAASFPNIFFFDESRSQTVFEDGYQSPGALTDNLEVGRGYTLFMNRARELAFTGTFTATAVPQTITNSGGVNPGWNLLGNPYPSPLDWDLVTIPAGMSSQVSVLQPVASPNGTGAVYLTYANGMGGNTLPGGIVPAAQGIFVRRTVAGSGTFTFQQTARVTTFNATNNHYRAAADARPVVRVAVEGTGALATVADEATVYFENGATDALDDRYDALRVGYSVGDAPSISTRLADNSLTQIDGRPELTAALSIPLDVRVGATGSYVLNTRELRNFAPGQVVLLEDAATGVTQDLSAVPSYAFRMDASFRGPRFTLHFRTAGVTGVASAAANALLSVYPNPSTGNVTVEWAGAQPLTGTVTLTDALGRTVRTLPAAGRLTLADLKAGVYTLRATGPQGALTRRVVVQ